MKRLNILLTTVVCLSSLNSLAQRRIEFFWDTDPGVGKGQMLGQLTDKEVSVKDSLDVGQLDPGIHVLGLRSLWQATDEKKTNADGYVGQTGDNKEKTFCSSVYARAFFIPEAAEEITRVEYSWDMEKKPGEGISLPFTSEANIIMVGNELSVADLTPGMHTLYVRSLSTNHRSATYARLFFIPDPEQHISRMEYSWDKEAAPGEGIPLQYTVLGDSAWYGPELSTEGLTEGIHTLYLRTLSGSYSSSTYARQFYVPATPREVEAIEYWFDVDPGVGKATRMAATMTADSLKAVFDVTTDGLNDGIHLIGLRTLTDGTWSETKVRRFLTRTQREDYVTHLEYFWNEDPGVGNGYSVNITPGEEISVDFLADMTMLWKQPHILGLRAQSGSLDWSPAFFVEDIEFDGWGIMGDANGDGRITITDAIATVNYIQLKPSKKFRVGLADMDGNGKITITDVIKIVNLIRQEDVKEE